MELRQSIKKRCLSVVVILALTVSLMTGMTSTVMAAEQDIVVLYTNDVHCGVDENIGYAGLVLYKKQMEAKTPHVALVDAGDAVQGAPIGTLSEGDSIISIMNKVGYDFAVPGNHEFDYGTPRFLELASKLKCGYYSCNYYDLQTQKTIFPGYKIMDFGKTQVAFIGVCTPETLTKSTPAYFQDEQGNYVYSFDEDEDGSRLYQTIQSNVDKVRRKGADVVILVGHLGEKGITSRWASHSIAANTSGIDAIIDGHSHETVAEDIVKNRKGKSVIVTQTGTKLENIGKMTIHSDGTISTELVSKVSGASYSSYTVKKGDTLARIAKKKLGSYNLWKGIYKANKKKIENPDVIKAGMKLKIPKAACKTDAGKFVEPTVDRYIKKLQAQYEEFMKTVLAHSDVELTDCDPTTGLRAVRNGETNLGDLCADAYRFQLGADIGLANGGGIRASMAAGDLTYQDFLTVFPFGNMSCLIKATGQQIKDALEMGACNYPEESGGFLQVSGLTYRINATIASSVQRDDKGNFKGVKGPYRVENIMVGGKPIDLSKTYTVASHSYMLKDGGDGMTMFKGCEVLLDETMLDVDLLAGYVNEKLDGNVGAKYGNPAGDGRIQIRKL